MHYQQPLASIMVVEKHQDVITTVVQVDREEYLCEPIAPGGLYSRDERAEIVLELHKVSHQEGSVVTFETYGHGGPVPAEGDQLEFRSWWVPHALDLVINTGLSWVRETYPDDGQHSLCLLTWKTLSSYTGDSEGYRAGNEWISVEGYEKYIRDDILRLRGH